MNVTHRPIAHKDSRGIIVDIVQNEPLEHVTLISMKAGSERGNHYHKESTQFVYVLGGKIWALARMPGGQVETATLTPGDLVVNEPLEEHALMALEESVFLVFTRGPRGGDQYESDTFRLEEPLSKLVKA